jgi:hypothetical protein
MREAGALAPVLSVSASVGEAAGRTAIVVNVGAFPDALAASRAARAPGHIRRRLASPASR